MVPELGALEAVEREHIAALHHRHRETPYQANRILEVVRKMFNLAEAWGLRKDSANPCRFVEKYKEHKRERFLTEGEFRRLGQVLNEVEAEGSETLSAVTAIRLPMLTGRRSGEVQTLRWENVDLEAGELRLPDSKTGGCRCRGRRQACSPPCLATRTTLGSLPAGSRGVISLTFNTPGGARAPGSTTCAFTTCGTASPRARWRWARACR